MRFFFEAPFAAFLPDFNGANPRKKPDMGPQGRHCAGHPIVGSAKPLIIFVVNCAWSAKCLAAANDIQEICVPKYMFSKPCEGGGQASRRRRRNRAAKKMRFCLEREAGVWRMGGSLAEFLKKGTRLWRRAAEARAPSPPPWAVLTRKTPVSGGNAIYRDLQRHLLSPHSLKGREEWGLCKVSP